MFHLIKEKSLYQKTCGRLLTCTAFEILFSILPKAVFDNLLRAAFRTFHKVPPGHFLNTLPESHHHVIAALPAFYIPQALS